MRNCCAKAGVTLRSIACNCATRSPPRVSRLLRRPERENQIRGTIGLIDGAQTRRPHSEDAALALRCSSIDAGVISLVAVLGQARGRDPQDEGYAKKGRDMSEESYVIAPPPRPVIAVVGTHKTFPVRRIWCV